MTPEQARELAERIAADLFTSGIGSAAERLVLWRDSDRRDLGGGCRESVVDRIAKAIAAAVPARCWRCGDPPDRGHGEGREVTEFELHDEYLTALETGQVHGWARRMIRRLADAIPAYDAACSERDAAILAEAEARRREEALAARVADLERHLAAKPSRRKAAQPQGDEQP